MTDKEQRRERPWIKLPLDMARDRSWTRTHIVLYANIAWRAGRRGYFYDTQATLADELNVSLSSVTHAITDLREAGYIRTDALGPNYSNVMRYYVLTQTDEVPDVDFREVHEELEKASQQETAEHSRQLIAEDPRQWIADSSIRPKKPPKNTPKKTETVSAQALIAKEVWESYHKLIQPKSRYRPSVERLILARLKEDSYKPEELVQAIERFASSEWWMSHCAKLGADWFFETDARIERFLLIEPDHKVPPPKPGTRSSGGRNAEQNGAKGQDGAAGRRSVDPELEKWR